MKNTHVYLYRVRFYVKVEQDVLRERNKLVLREYIRPTLNTFQIFQEMPKKPASFTQLEKRLDRMTTV